MSDLTYTLNELEKQKIAETRDMLKNPWLLSTRGSRPMYRLGPDNSKEWWWTAPEAGVI